MKKLLNLLLFLSVLVLSACDVHEWPEPPQIVKFRLQLNYETNMTEWYYSYDGFEVTEESFGDTYDNSVEYGKIRYIIRAYPILPNQRAVQEHTHEFIITKDVVQGYNHDVVLEIPAGEYQIMVWSDLQKSTNDAYFYNAENFAEIMLQGEHAGNTDYRDAFRGTGEISLISDVVYHDPSILNITMQRPMAKFEFISTDLKEFIDKEYEYLQKEAATRGELPPTRVNLSNYNVIVNFSEYMPCAYNMYTDKPVDAKRNVVFESKINVLSENDASLGFDYVFINGINSPVTVRVGLYDNTGRQLALSDNIVIPLRRSHHTILKGSFLMKQTSGGIAIDPEFEGEHIHEIE